MKRRKKGGGGVKVFRKIGTRVRGEEDGRVREERETKAGRQSERIRDSNRRLSTIVPATNYVC